MSTTEWIKVSRRMRALFKGEVESGAARCWRCGQPIAPGSLWDLDHRVPLSRGGGMTDLSNLSPSHRVCNRRHGAYLRHQKSPAVVVPVRRPSL